jgi:cell division cycle 2-like protein
MEKKRSKWESDDDENQTATAKPARRQREKRKKAAKQPPPAEITHWPASNGPLPDQYHPPKPSPGPSIVSCGSVDELYKKLNRIEEGTYGVVYRAHHLPTGDIVALKKFKLDANDKEEGFRLTSLREICTLLHAHHPNIIQVREVVTGASDPNQYVHNHVYICSMYT